MLEKQLSKGVDLEEALVVYNKERRRRLGFYQMMSRVLTPVFQSDMDTVGLLRDWFMAPLGDFPLVRWQMGATLVGAKNHVLGVIDRHEYLDFFQTADRCSSFFDSSPVRNS